MIEIDVKIRDSLSPALVKVLDAFEGEGAEDFNAVGARSANTAAIEYHDEFNQSGGWKGSKYLDGPGRTPGDFGKNIALGWNFESSDKEGATISNNADYYAFKVKGGTITPKRAKALTIPLVAEAAGRRARDYESATGHRLFLVTGKSALFEKKEGGGIRAVYALVDRVTHQPWPKALPDTETMSEAFTEGWLGAFADALEGGPA